MKTFLFSLIAIGTLGLFNPDQAAFASYMSERAQTTVTDNARQAPTSFLGGANAVTSQAQTASEYKRSSYLVFSTYTLDAHGTSRGVDYRYLGIGGQFFQVKKPEAEHP